MRRAAGDWTATGKRVPRVLQSHVFFATMRIALLHLSERVAPADPPLGNSGLIRVGPRHSAAFLRLLPPAVTVRPAESGHIHPAFRYLRSPDVF